MELKSTAGLALSIKFTGTHLYTWVERGSVKVKCLAHAQGPVPLPDLYSDSLSYPVSSAGGILIA